MTQSKPLIFKKALSDVDRESVENYLAEKYQIELPGINDLPKSITVCCHADWDIKQRVDGECCIICEKCGEETETVMRRMIK